MSILVFTYRYIRYSVTESSVNLIELNSLTGYIQPERFSSLPATIPS